jgi:thiamine biosynthesis lipoprotein
VPEFVRAPVIDRGRSLSWLGFLALAIGAAAPDAIADTTPAERARMLMGTLCTARFACGDTVRSAAAATRSLDEIARLEPVMSSWSTTSELSALNAHAADTTVRCSPDLHAVLASALAAARLTDGAFDPTIEPLNRVWDMRGDGRVPANAELRDALRLVGWRHVRFDSVAHTVRFAQRGMGIDLGGIGKGYALERALAASGDCDDAFLNFGGEILAIGPARDIGIADPRDRLRPALSLSITSAAVSTSSQNERGVEIEGRHHGHILDPRTGRPVPGRASVTVVLTPRNGATPPAAMADALSTALLVMGRDRAGAFARRHRIGVVWLEPTTGPLNAWVWNLSTVRAAPGAIVVIHT